MTDCTERSEGREGIPSRLSMIGGFLEPGPRVARQ
jgi:hypothetical protein